MASLKEGVGNGGRRLGDQGKKGMGRVPKGGREWEEVGREGTPSKCKRRQPVQNAQGAVAGGRKNSGSMSVRRC